VIEILDKTHQEKNHVNNPSKIQNPTTDLATLVLIALSFYQQLF
jgi:hypothetical protein